MPRTRPAASPPALIAGPYRAPRCRKGRILYDHVRGDVEVCGTSEAPIPWPVALTGPNARIPLPVCDDELLRALRTESVEAVAYWWGIHRHTLWRRKHALGIPRFTPGTTARYRELAPDKLRGRGGRLEPKITTTQAAAIRRRSAAGESRSSLAREFKVSRQLVSQIARGLRHRILP